MEEQLGSATINALYNENIMHTIKYWCPPDSIIMKETKYFGENVSLKIPSERYTLDKYTTHSICSMEPPGSLSNVSIDARTAYFVMPDTDIELRFTYDHQYLNISNRNMDINGIFIPELSVSGNDALLAMPYGSNLDIVIPCDIRGIPVLGIAPRAFDLCAALRSIELPNTVTKIGEHAFASCTLGEDVRIPESVIEISSNAFEGSRVRWIIIKKPMDSIPGAPWGLRDGEIIWLG